MKKTRPIPFEFVLERLARLDPVVRPMFGCHAVYVREKCVLILCKRQDHPSDNGVWIATTFEHHGTLKRDLPSLRSIVRFGRKSTKWQTVPENSESFEEEVQKACDLILRGDLRIGVSGTGDL